MCARRWRHQDTPDDRKPSARHFCTHPEKIHPSRRTSLKPLLIQLSIVWDVPLRTSRCNKAPAGPFTYLCCHIRTTPTKKCRTTLDQAPDVMDTATQLPLLPSTCWRTGLCSATCPAMFLLKQIDEVLHFTLNKFLAPKWVPPFVATTSNPRATTKIVGQKVSSMFLPNPCAMAMAMINDAEVRGHSHHSMLRFFAKKLNRLLNSRIFETTPNHQFTFEQGLCRMDCCLILGCFSDEAFVLAERDVRRRDSAFPQDLHLMAPCISACASVPASSQRTRPGHDRHAPWSSRLGSCSIAQHSSKTILARCVVSLAESTSQLLRAPSLTKCCLSVRHRSTRNSWV